MCFDDSFPLGTESQNFSQFHSLFFLPIEVGFICAGYLGRNRITMYSSSLEKELHISTVSFVINEYILDEGDGVVLVLYSTLGAVLLVLYQSSMISLNIILSLSTKSTE